MRQKRLYLKYCERSISAMYSAISSFNSVYDRYKIETTLILLVNAWELLGKAVLIRLRESIYKDKHNSLSAEQIVMKLENKGILDENQSAHLQQVISLRNESAHGILPVIPIEILHHLFYFSCKFYKDTMSKKFPRHKEAFTGNYLSISFNDLTTYADKVQKLVSRFRRGSDNERRIVWLLERGVRFDGAGYIPQDRFEKEFKAKAKWKLLPHLELGKYLKNSDMVRIVAVQAPKNYTADITLRKGKQSDNSLPVQIKKTDVELDYPYLTSELAQKLGKNTQYISSATKKLGLRNNKLYHQAVRSSQKNAIQKYSEATYIHLKTFFEKTPNYDPYR